MEDELKIKDCKMECGEKADYDGKYCWTCVERMIEESEGK